MELPAIEHALLRLAKRAGFSVRRVAFDRRDGRQDATRGGACLVRGRPIILIDDHAACIDRVVTLADALCALDTSRLDLPDPVRARLELSAHRLRARAARRPPRLWLVR